MTANEAQVEYWNGRAGDVWAALQDRIDRQLDPLGRAAMAALAPRSGEHILDVGCGAGQTSLQLAEAVGAAGRVVGVDVSAQLLDRARARPGTAPVSFVRADAQAHAFAETFDAIYSRFGVMFFADPAAAFANLRRALKPGGRIAFVCWRDVTENPLMTVPMVAALQHLPPQTVSPPDPQAPGPFAFADRARVARILAAAGFGGIDIAPLDEPVGGNDRAVTLELAVQLGPLGRILRENPGYREAVIGAVDAAIESFMVDGIARVPSATWIVTATNRD